MNEPWPLSESVHTLCVGNEIAQQPTIVAHEWYHRHYMDIPSEVFGPGDVQWECKACTST